MRVFRILLLAVCTTIPGLSQRSGPAPEPIDLWPDGAPLAKGTADEDRPTLAIYLPEKPIGTAVVICPGGGYRNLAIDHEGDQIARWYNSLGIAAFVLKYRLGPKYNHPVELSDVQRAIRIVREGAWRYGVRPDRIGVMGFSAGGHLASTAATHFDAGDASAKDPIDRVSSRPDYAVLCYPVISLTSEYTHQGSKTNLLGENPDPALAESLSNDKQITPETPPTFLWHTNEDTSVPAENSVLFYLGLRKAGVPAELHIFERGRHGMGLAWTDRVLSAWPDLLANWLYSRGLLTD